MGANNRDPGALSRSDGRSIRRSGAHTASIGSSSSRLLPGLAGRKTTSPLNSNLMWRCIPTTASAQDYRQRKPAAKPSSCWAVQSKPARLIANAVPFPGSIPFSRTSLWPAHTAPQPRFYHHRRTHTGPRHRRMHRNLQPGECGVLIRSLPYGDPNRLVYLFTPNPHIPVPPDVMSPSYADFYDIKRESHSYSDMSVFEQATYNLSSQGSVERVSAARVDESFFTTLPVGAGVWPRDWRG